MWLFEHIFTKLTNNFFFSAGNTYNIVFIHFVLGIPFYVIFEICWSAGIFARFLEWSVMIGRVYALAAGDRSSGRRLQHSTWLSVHRVWWTWTCVTVLACLDLCCSRQYTVYQVIRIKLWLRLFILKFELVRSKEIVRYFSARLFLFSSKQFSSTSLFVYG